MGKITEEKNNVGDNNEERDTFNEDIKETSSRVRLRKPKKKVSVLNYIICIRGSTSDVAVTLEKLRQSVDALLWVALEVASYTPHVAIV